jgi:hypothetical protein
LAFTKDSIDDDLFGYICVPLSSLKILELKLDHQKITNQALQLLAKTFLQTSKALKSLTLDLRRIMVTEKGVLKLLERSHGLTCLELNLNVAKVPMD